MAGAQGRAVCLLGVGGKRVAGRQFQDGVGEAAAHAFSLEHLAEMLVADSQVGGGGAVAPAAGEEVFSGRLHGARQARGSDWCEWHDGLGVGG